MGTNKRLSSYEIVASAFNVLEIATEIKYSFPPDKSLLEIWEEIAEEGIDPTEDWAYLVRDDNEIYGFLDYFSHYNGPNIEVDTARVREI